MKKMKKCGKVLVMLVVLLMTMCLMSACSAVKVSGDLIINSDGTGTRKIIGKIDKVSVDADNGCTYYYFKQHGDELQKWMADKYIEKVPGSEEWLNIEVIDGSANETVTLSFDFTSFEEYTSRLQALGFDENHAGSYVEPVINVVDGKIESYSETTGVMTAIMKSIQMAVLGDTTIYDDACTNEDGLSLNGGSSEGVTETNGIELVGAGSGPALTIQADGHKAQGLFAAKESEEEGALELYTYTVKEEEEELVADDTVSPTVVPTAIPTVPPTVADTATEEATKGGVSPVLIVVIVVVVVAVCALLVVKSKKKKA